MTETKPRKHVVIGLLLNAAGELCVAKRREDAHLGGLWEIPGGKREAHETVFACLQRELYEELGIVVKSAEAYDAYDWDYPEVGKYVHLDFWQVLDFEGEPHGKEGQPVKWLRAQEFSAYTFPKANERVLMRLLATKQVS